MSMTTQDSKPSHIRMFLEWTAANLSRVTSTHEFIPEVDGLRFVALLPVLFLHSAGTMMWVRGRADHSIWAFHDGRTLRILALGGIGVQIFFVISGFVVALPFARYALKGAPRPRLSNYFLRRVTRIEPPYFLALLASYAQSRAYVRLLPDLVAGMFYMHQIVFGTWNPVNFVTWSLEAEVLFYILAPWLTKVYLIADRTNRWALQMIVIAAYGNFVQFWLVPYGPSRFNESFFSYLPYFMAGILLADLYASGMVRRSGKIVWDLAAIAGGAAAFYAWGWGWNHWLAPFMVMTMFVGGLKGRFVNMFLRMRPITIIGGMCYTVYLWHPVMLTLIGLRLGNLIPDRIQDGPAALLFCLMAVPIILVGTAPIFFFIEKPFMNGPGSRFLTRVLRRIGEAIQRKPRIAVDQAG